MVIVKYIFKEPRICGTTNNCNIIIVKRVILVNGILTTYSIPLNCAVETFVEISMLVAINAKIPNTSIEATEIIELYLNLINLGKSTIRLPIAKQKGGMISIM